MKAFDIQKKFFNDVMYGNNLSNKNKYIYNELIEFRMFEVIKSSYPIYTKYISEEFLKIQVKSFISYGAKSAYVWKSIFEFKDFLFQDKNINKCAKQILTFESKQIKIYSLSLDIKAKKISKNRSYRLSKNCSLEVHNYDIINQTFNKIKAKYYLIYKDINDYDVYYVELSKFLYYFLKYQKSNNTINKAIKLASNRANLNYNDTKEISKNIIKNFINTAIII